MSQHNVALSTSVRQFTPIKYEVNEIPALSLVQPRRLEDDAARVEPSNALGKNIQESPGRTTIGKTLGLLADCPAQPCPRSSAYAPLVHN
jgi:hypothetical protein